MKNYKVMSEAQFLAGEDARGVLVILEPETDLSTGHLDALVARGAAGFISDFTSARFERPDEKPTLNYDKAYGLVRGRDSHGRWREPFELSDIEFSSCS